MLKVIYALMFIFYASLHASAGLYVPKTSIEKKLYNNTIEVKDKYGIKITNIQNISRTSKEIRNGFDFVIQDGEKFVRNFLFQQYDIDSAIANMKDEESKKEFQKSLKEFEKSITGFKGKGQVSIKNDEKKVYTKLIFNDPSSTPLAKKPSVFLDFVKEGKLVMHVISDFSSNIEKITMDDIVLKDKKTALSINNIIIFSVIQEGFKSSIDNISLLTDSKKEKVSFKVSGIKYFQAKSATKYKNGFFIKDISLSNNMIKEIFKIQISDISLKSAANIKNKRLKATSFVKIGKIKGSDEKNKKKQVFGLENLGLGSMISNVYIGDFDIKQFEDISKKIQTNQKLSKKEEQKIEDTFVSLVSKGLSFKSAIGVDKLYLDKMFKLHAPFKFNVSIDLAKNGFSKKMFSKSSDEIQNYLMNYLKLSAKLELAKKDLETIKQLGLQQGLPPMAIGFLGFGKVDGEKVIFDLKASTKEIKLNGIDLMPKPQSKRH